MFIALVDWDKCSGCGECVQRCPANCFEMLNGKSNAHRATSCMDCGNCKEQCPEKAIIISMGWGGYKLPAYR